MPYATAAGASPLFPPQYPTPEAAQEAIQHLVQRDPRACGLSLTRWTLAAIRQTCDWLRGCTLSAVCQILNRLKIVWKRARAAIRSPDPDYEEKLADIAELLADARRSDGSCVVLYLDEVTVERQPTLANAYAERGGDQPRAQLSRRSNMQTRVVGGLNAMTGQVTYRQAGKITMRTLVQLYQDICAAYPTAERIFVIQDNWPIHTHPDVLVALEPQTTRWPFARPASWPTEPSAAARRRWGHLQLPIQIVPLPTYASWCNPIEKLWRKLRQEMTHLHRWADDFPQLREAMNEFLDQFAGGSSDLLRYVGLSTGFNS